MSTAPNGDFPPLGVPIAVFYKFYDDQGNYMVAAITYYAFVAIFPLLLLATSILGFFLQGNEELQETVLDSALAQFPIIGEQLGRPEGIQGSTTGIVVGFLVALFGASGLGQAIQNTMNTAWAVPRNSRPNPFFTRFKSLLLLTMAGSAVLAVSVLSTLGANTEVFGSGLNRTIRLLILVATVIVVGLVLTALSRVATARHDYVGRSWPGAFTVAVLWQGLQYVGTWYATTVITGSKGMNQTFALVLGLIGMIYLAAIIGVLGIEINVVLARKLWPRSLMTLFTDNVDLTDADRRTYAGLVHMNVLKGFESASVRFEGRDGDTHEIVLEPKTPPNGVPMTRAPHTEAGTETVPTAEPEKTQPIRRRVNRRIAAARTGSRRAGSPRRRRPSGRRGASCRPPGSPSGHRRRPGRPAAGAAPGIGRHQDPVERALVGQAQDPGLRLADLGPGQRGASQVGGAELHQVRLQLDADDASARSGQLGQQRGGPARARSDVEHAVSGSDVEEPQHRLDRAGLRVGLAAADLERAVVRRAAELGRRQETGPGDGAEGRDDRVHASSQPRPPVSSP